MRPSPRRLTAALLLVSLVIQAAAQTRQKPVESAPACDVERAAQLVRQQFDEAKVLASGAQRSAVMTRAAELLWPFDEPRARAALAEAFDIASSHYRQHGVETTRVPPKRADATYPGRTTSQPDPRMAVIRAVASRDRAWAERLGARAAEDTRRRALEGADRARGEREASERLVSMARSFVSSDTAVALGLAHESLRHPASRFLGYFIHDVAGVDRAAADAFYADALRAYSGADVASLLELSAYPFALANNLGLRPGYNLAGHAPVKFAPSPELQRRFVAAFLRLAESKLRAAAGQPPPPDDPREGAPDAELIYSALVSLETLYGPSDKSFAAVAEPLKQMAGGMLTGGGLRRATVNGEGGARPPVRPQVETDRVENVLTQARALRDLDQHDRRIVTGLWGYLGEESVERLESVAAEIKDETVRGQFLDGLYFQQALRAAKAGRVEEASKAAERVRSLEQRAALMWELMQSELKQSGDAPGARALAESVYKSAQRAPESEEKARALLGLAYFHARLEPTRAPSLLAEAASAINRSPEFGQAGPNVVLTVEGRTYNFYSFNPTPGFHLDLVLREVAARDLDAALEAASALDDKRLRAFAVFSSVSKCLEEAAKTLKPAAPKRTPAATKADSPPKPQTPPKKRPRVER